MIGIVGKIVVAVVVRMDVATGAINGLGQVVGCGGGKDGPMVEDGIAPWRNGRVGVPSSKAGFGVVTVDPAAAAAGQPSTSARREENWCICC